jgi:hypothetical protein
LGVGGEISVGKKKQKKKRFQHIHREFLMERRMNFKELAMLHLLGSLFMLGCSASSSDCSHAQPCPDGSRCIIEEGVGICELVAAGNPAEPGNSDEPEDTDFHLHTSIWLEERSAWGRDDALFVQVQSTGKVDWAKAEVWAGGQLATRVLCPLSFPAVRPEVEAGCFEVQLSALPGLPHGEYALNVTTHLTNQANDSKSHTQSLPMRINRELWTSSAWTDLVGTGVVTREGLLLLLNQQRLVAINARGEEVWSTEVPNPEEKFLLGNHRGMDVAVGTCTSPEPEGTAKGFWAVNARTGRNLTPGCSAASLGNVGLLLLQSGPDKNLVIGRQVPLQTTPGYALEAYYLVRVTSSLSSPWGFIAANRTPEALSFLYSNFLARRTPEGAARVFVGFNNPSWRAVDWSEEEGWSPGYVKEGAESMGIQSELRFLGAKRLWVSHFVLLGMREGSANWLQVLDQEETNWGALILNGYTMFNSTHPLLVDVGDEVIAQGAVHETLAVDPLEGHVPKLQKYSADGSLLFAREGGRGIGGRNLALMEGGDMVYLNASGGISCLKFDFAHCSVGNAANGAAQGQLLGILPMSSTRSIAVFAHENVVSAFLVDASGLKKDAPWPIEGHDLCRTYNASIPIDNCWDGAKG